MTAPGPDAGSRVRAVRHHYARRGDRGTVRGRAYALYLVALFGVFYLLPVVHAVSTSPALLPLGSSAAATAVACGLATSACWAALLAGRYAGPLVVPPFLLYVFRSTDLSPASYLGRIARRRLTRAGAVTAALVCAAAYLTTDLFDHLGTASAGFAVAAGTGALTAVAWLWGQVRAVADTLVLAAAAGAAAAAVTVLGRTVTDGGLWLLAVVLAAAAGALGRTALRSVRTVDLARLARESARASEARAYAWTGTLHHALDLYRPEPRGLTTALFRTDGRLRGPLVQGAVRTLRTPGRATAAAGFLLIGGAALTSGAAEPSGGPAPYAFLAGAVCVYLASGWLGETWRALRDELTLAPLFGGGWGALLARTLAWPVVAVPAGACLGGGLALLALPPLDAARPVDTLLLVAGALALVLGARFLREMKLQLPLGLLLPVITPFGDLSGLLLVAWQFDGLVAVVTGAALVHAVPSAAGAAALALALSACFVLTGLRRTGRTYRGLFPGLRRTQDPPGQTARPAPGR